MNSSHHSQPSALPESDMTPMVDVTFLLLIFFMVTATFSMQSSMAVADRNDVGPQSVDRVSAAIVVEVDEFNTFHVRAGDWEREAPSEHDLIRALWEVQARVSGSEPLDRMLVKANPDALHEKVVAALDSGAYVGIPQIALLTLE